MTKRPAFLRTPKRQEGQGTFWRALWSSRTEALLAAAAVVGAAAMVVRAPSWAAAALALLLLFQAFLYSSAVWASMAAEGIKLTPTREAYRRSAQSSGERPGRGGRLLAIPVAAGLFAVVVLGLAALSSPSSVPENNNPAVAPLTGGPAPKSHGHRNSAPPAPPSPVDTTSPTPTPAPSPS